MKYLLFVDIDGEHVFVGQANTLHAAYQLIWDECNNIRNNYSVDFLHWLVFRSVEKILDFYQ